MQVLAAIGIATGMLVLLLLALAPVLVELNERLPVRPAARAVRATRTERTRITTTRQRLSETRDTIGSARLGLR
ncbi:hypothetical protein [Amycolatopsis aidingensis]|uniref:hypothetical protein n=1 Tax=Amycolatopsis aidingensis TaxID=2842453 RepID=UPI001C0BE3ED|nr:hypothetical protein [Amycolatopsis aidingensis]